MLKQRLFLYNVIIIMTAVAASLVLFLIPATISGNSAFQQALSFLIGLFFWIFIVAEAVFVFFASRERKKTQQLKYRNRIIAQAMPGVITFFKNREALIADLAFFISIVFIAVVIFAGIMSPWVIVSSFAAVLLTFNLHCIFNGKNYRYMKAFIQYKKEHE